MFFVYLATFAVTTIFLLSRIRAKSAPKSPRIAGFDTRPGDANSGVIPKIIWSYWHTPEQPTVVQRCVRNWIRHCPDYEVRMVSESTLDRYVDRAELPASFVSLPPVRQSDWLRLYFLRRYGGIWLDSSTILTRSLDWLRNVQAEGHADYVGFYLDRYTAKAERPVIDSWAMAAPAGSRFICDWFDEFVGRSAAMGDAAYLAELKTQGVYDDVVQGIASPLYMMIHVAAQRVLHRGGPYRLRLIRAEDSAYFYQSISHWKRGFFFANILIRRCAEHPPALVKLRGGERRKLEPYLRWNFFSRNSLAGVHLCA